MEDGRRGADIGGDVGEDGEVRAQRGAAYANGKRAPEGALGRHKTGLSSGGAFAAQQADAREARDQQEATSG